MPTVAHTGVIATMTGVTPETTPGAVSYTHLDVYKRQTVGI